MNEPLIHVGILLHQFEIDFELLSTYKLNGKEFCAGNYSVKVVDGKILFNGLPCDELVFETDNLHTGSFELKNVIIGEY